MIYEFKFPDVGEGVHEGKVLQYKVKPGEKVEPGDILAVVETDKVVAEIPSPKEGIVDKFGVEEGQIIKVGEVLAYIKIDGGAEEEKPVFKEEAAGVVGELEVAGDTVLPPGGEGVFDRSPEAVSLVPGRERPRATPVARKLAADYNVDLASVKGSGPGGRVMKSDILNFIERKPAKPVEKPAEKKERPEVVSVSSPEPTLKITPSSQVTITPLSTLRKTIAENMEASQNIPAAIIHDYGIVDDLVVFREEVNREREERLSFQAFFIKALSAAIRSYPILNSTYDPAKKEITTYQYVNVGLAVDTEAGLMVPVIKNVEKKSIAEINSEMRRLVEAAKSRTINLEDLRGGTISITNYGAFGGVYGRPMILPPQAAILGIGRLHRAPVIKGDEVVPAWVLPLSLPFDHRVVDGAMASSFLTHLLSLLASPEKLLLSI